MKAKAKKRPLNSELTTEAGLKKLGKRIKDLRTKAGFSSYEYFAYEHNISRAQMGRYENGQDLRFSVDCCRSEKVLKWFIPLSITSFPFLNLGLLL